MDKPYPHRSATFGAGPGTMYLTAGVSMDTIYNIKNDGKSKNYVYLCKM